jgi:branched-chain amino acid transport system permease protein
MKGLAPKALATPAALALAALAYFVPSVSGGTPVVYAACTTIAILAVMSYGADLILSYLGEVSLGHTIFWAAGGYAVAILAVSAGWNGWSTAGAAIVVSLGLAGVLGLVSLRTREFVFSLVTYAAVGGDGASIVPRRLRRHRRPPLQLTCSAAAYRLG